MLQLVAAVLREIFGRFSQKLPLRKTFVISLLQRGTFVGSVGRLRYVGPLSSQLIAFTLCRLSWSTPLYVRPIPFVTSPPLRLFSQNRSSLRARTCIASRQV